MTSARTRLVVARDVYLFGTAFIETAVLDLQGDEEKTKALAQQVMGSLENALSIMTISNVLNVTEN
ncbi:hypothetical protein SAMN04487859_112137 [Roseovarius lutimaris]|uniref:Uncharacterized protein n=1 Tax=Roseovarius lutimaris TaxID=1005928 RepID=A0A1I5DHT2_9RHOB|nr:hypothetical protein [Roseovarius lutimaris]SFN98799.1 hypothetical protein SAMN04487859_112137 [Roseovarius lutimaris]